MPCEGCLTRRNGRLHAQHVSEPMAREVVRTEDMLRNKRWRRDVGVRMGSKALLRSATSPRLGSSKRFKLPRLER